MSTQLNLKLRQYISLLIWVFCFGFTGVATFAFSGKYYGPVWSLSMLIIFLPHFYWAHLTIHFSRDTRTRSKATSYFKLAFLVAFISLCLMLFRFSLPVTMDSSQLEALLSLSAYLFFGATFFSFFIAAQALVKRERSIFNTSPYTFLAFLTFCYLPIGIFFLVPRLRKLRESLHNTFD